MVQSLKLTESREESLKSQRAASIRMISPPRQPFTHDVEVADGSTSISKIDSSLLVTKSVDVPQRAVKQR
jgi:hypothetical protein